MYKLQKSKILFFVLSLSLFCFANDTYAATIETVNGNFQNGETITISGSGFGEKSPAKPYLWAPFDGSINPSVSGRVTAWDEINNMEYNSTEGSNGTGCAKAINSSGFWTLMVQANDFAWNDLNQQMYVYRKTKKNFFVDGNFNWKDWRIWGPGFSTPTMWFSTSNGTFSVANIVPSGGYPLNENSRGSANEWHNEEWIIKANSEIALDDAIFHFWIDGIDIGGLPYTDYMTHTICMNDGSGPMVMNFIVHGVLANTTFPSDYRYWADDVYLDTSWARILICSGSDWGNRQNCEIQIPTEWNSNGQYIAATINQGSFINNKAYLYIIDSNGVISDHNSDIEGDQGYEVQFGNSSEDTTAPSAPLGLSVI